MQVIVGINDKGNFSIKHDPFGRGEGRLSQSTNYAKVGFPTKIQPINNDNGTFPRQPNNFDVFSNPILNHLAQL